MNRSTLYFRLVAVIFIGFGIAAVAIPDEYIALLGVDASVGGRLWGRAFGAASVGFGVMLWMMDPVSHRREQRIGAVGASVAFGLTALTDTVSVIGGDLSGYGWVFVAFNVVMAGLAIMLLGDRRAAPRAHGVGDR